MGKRPFRSDRSSADRVRELISFDLGCSSANSASEGAEFERGSSIDSTTGYSRGNHLLESDLGQLALFPTSSSEKLPSLIHPGSGEGSESPLEWKGGDSDARRLTDCQWRSLAGFDEAGRGALAGPVVVGCVSFDRFDDPVTRAILEEELIGLDDSKKVSPKNREALFERITEIGLWSIGAASAREIDRLGIVPACVLAADRACRRLGRSFDLALCDRGLGLSRLPIGADRVSFTKGDARSFHISAASIVAKVSRDRLICELAGRFPGYELERHKGYGTEAHRAALQRLGPSKIHRASFLKGRSAENQFC